MYVIPIICYHVNIKGTSTDLGVQKHYRTTRTPYHTKCAMLAIPSLTYWLAIDQAYYLNGSLLGVKWKIPGKLGILALHVGGNGLMKHFLYNFSIHV